LRRLPDDRPGADAGPIVGSVERTTFSTSDAVELSGRLWLQERPTAAVVLVHGFTASADARPVVTVAEALYAEGLDVISYDARGHGRSGGESTLGDLERHDVAAAVSLARDRCEEVVVVGASMGAIAALRHATDDHGIAGTVLVSCPAAWRLPRNVPGVAAAVLTRTMVGRLLARRLLGLRIAAGWNSPEPPITLASRVRTPLSILHGAVDRFIPASDAVELQCRTTTRCRLRIIPELGHAFQPAAIPEIVASVRWVLADAGANDEGLPGFPPPGEANETGPGMGHHHGPELANELLLGEHEALHEGQ
jgi:alpha-beta hydrolase superfamily lysophospholipase